MVSGGRDQFAIYESGLSERRIEIRVTVGDHHVEKGYANLDYRFTNKTTGQLIAQGYQIIFFYNSKTGKRVSISGEFRKLL